MATSGPWDDRRIGRLGDGRGATQHEQLCNPEGTGAMMLEHDGSDEGNANAIFIANARADVPELVARVRELEARHQAAGREAGGCACTANHSCGCGYRVARALVG